MPCIGYILDDTGIFVLWSTLGTSVRPDTRSKQIVDDLFPLSALQIKHTHSQNRAPKLNTSALDRNCTSSWPVSSGDKIERRILHSNSSSGDCFHIISCTAAIMEHGKGRISRLVARIRHRRRVPCQYTSIFHVTGTKVEHVFVALLILPAFSKIPA